MDRDRHDHHADILDLHALGSGVGSIPIAVALIGWFWPKGTPEDLA